MTIETRSPRVSLTQSGGIMSTFAELPNPAGQFGQVRLATNVGPSPGTQLISNNVIWRPTNGQAVLAHKGSDPITVQNTAGAVAETIGPFPGGLVRKGMTLEFDMRFRFDAYTASSRWAKVRIGNGATRNEAFKGTSLNNNAIGLNGRINSTIEVASDTTANHSAAFDTYGSFSANGSTTFTRTPGVDFSQDWYMDFFFQSANETAKTITGMTWSAGFATFNSTAHTLAIGDKTTVAGVAPAGANGEYIVTSKTDDTFTVPMAVDPGAYVSGGTSSRISNMILNSYILILRG